MSYTPFTPTTLINDAELNNRFDELNGGGTGATDDWLIRQTINETFFNVSGVIYNPVTGVLSSSNIAFEDGATGVLTTTIENAEFFAIDAFTLTHSLSGKIVTQSSVTRDTNGNVITRPIPTVA